jgi:putative membrane protein insertion efficiency factor
MKKLAVRLLSVYKILVSPALEILFGKGCRYNPTCSEYAALAIENHGLYKGTVLAMRRFMNCQPFSSVQIDPVPEK